MAKIQIKMPEQFLQKCSRLSNKTDDIIEKTLEAGGAVVYQKVCSNLQSVIGKDTKKPSETTGELLDSLGISPVKIDHKGTHNVKIGFNEPRRKQYAAKKKRSYYTIANAMIANVLEYGKHNQPPRPFLKPARAASRKDCVKAMEATFEEEVNKL